MRSTSTTLLFGAVVLFALGQVAWWTTVLTRDASRLEAAAAALERSDSQAVVAALGAKDTAALRERAASRRTMFFAEGIAFLCLTALGSVLFFVATRRERRVYADHNRFLAAATHELKTPIATLRLGLQSIEARAENAPARDKRYVRDMLGELARLEGGVTNILTAAGLRSASGAGRLAQGDLRDDVLAAVREVVPRARAAEIDLIADAVAPCRGSRDPEAVRLIVHNLLDNAVKHSAPGDRVVVRLERQARGARIEVHDSGAGFEPERAASLFEPFRQGGNHAGPTGGIGLGLHLVRELTRAHGGTVCGESPGVGKGARFVVELPLERSSDLVPAVPEAAI